MHGHGICSNKQEICLKKQETKLAGRTRAGIIFLSPDPNLSSDAFADAERCEIFTCHHDEDKP
jgi:hypothetical protein